MYVHGDLRDVKYHMITTRHNKMNIKCMSGNDCRHVIINRSVSFQLKSFCIYSIPRLIFSFIVLW